MTDTTDTTDTPTPAAATPTTQPGTGGITVTTMPPKYAPNPASQEAQQQAPWYDTFPDEVKGTVLNKKWTSPEEAVKAYTNLEQFMGAEKSGNGVIIPKADDADAWGKVYDRLGRPETPDKYELPEGNLAAAMAPALHEAGLNKAQAQKLSAAYEAAQKQHAEAETQKYSLELAEAEASLKKEWSKDYKTNMETAKKAAAAFGLDGKSAAQLAEAVGGNANLARFMHNVGVKMGEHANAGENLPRGGGVLTPGDAQSAINSLTQNETFFKKLQGGDQEAQAEWSRLNKLASLGS